VITAREPLAADVPSPVQRVSLVAIEHGRVEHERDAQARAHAHTHAPSDLERTARVADERIPRREARQVGEGPDRESDFLEALGTGGRRGLLQDVRGVETAQAAGENLIPPLRLTQGGGRVVRLHLAAKVRFGGLKERGAKHERQEGRCGH
jgi:hypothetical protein